MLQKNVVFPTTELTNHFLIFQHFEKELHKKFLENSENFAELEKLISTLPSVEDFIAKIKKEEEPTK